VIDFFDASRLDRAFFLMVNAPVVVWRGETRRVTGSRPVDTPVLRGARTGHARPTAAQRPPRLPPRAKNRVASRRHPISGCP